MANKLYEIKSFTNTIKFTSRCAIKIGDNFYTVEATEERIVPEVDSIDMDLEWKDLCDSVNDVVDGQAKEIVETFKSRR